MQSKKPRTAGEKRKPKPGATKGKRLRPVSLHPMKFDEVMQRLIGRTRPR
jgi:hypothetical protein